MNFVRDMVWTRVSKGWDVPWDALGQFGTERPVVHLSQDKNISLSHCPLSRGKERSKNLRTNSSVLGLPGQIHFHKRNQKTGKGRFKTGKLSSKTGKDVLKQEIIGKNSDCPVPGPGFWQSVPARSVPWQDFELVLLHCPVPLETLVWTTTTT